MRWLILIIGLLLCGSLVWAASQNLLPGYGVVDETGTDQNLLPGYGVVDETVSEVAADTGGGATFYGCTLQGGTFF